MTRILAWIITWQSVKLTVLATFGIALAGCAATTAQIIPTARPTETETPVITATNTPESIVTDTPVPSPARLEFGSGPTPTSIFGPTRTPNPDEPTPTQPADPSAPRIEFFTTSASSVEPGGALTLFWSIRNVNRAVIYRLDRGGNPVEVINIGAEGRYQFQTSRRDRGQIDFRLVAGENQRQVEARLTVPLACPIAWFFGPSPAECPDNAAVETRIIEQTFERGRMLYLADTDQVYVLFNDGQSPAWISFPNLYDPEVHPESLDNFPTGPGQFQPIARLGFVWRGNDSVRNRLGLGTNPEVEYEGFYQTATLDGGGTGLYISSINQVVLQLLPRGNAWQLITAP